MWVALSQPGIRLAEIRHQGSGPRHEAKPAYFDRLFGVERQILEGVSAVRRGFGATWV